MMCNCWLFVMLLGSRVGGLEGLEGGGRHMTTLLWCSSPFWEFLTRSSVRFLKLVFSLCKEKSPRLLRNEVSDNVPEYSGPFFFVVVVLINTVCFSKLL